MPRGANAPRRSGRVSLFTFNNPPQGTDTVLNVAAFNAAAEGNGRRRVRGLVYQFERGVGTGTLHVQGCLRWDDNVSLPRAIRIIQAVCAGAHVQIANGTWADNVAYCSKGTA